MMSFVAVDVDVVTFDLLAVPRFNTGKFNGWYLYQI